MKLIPERLLFNWQTNGQISMLYVTNFSSSTFKLVIKKRWHISPPKIFTNFSCGNNQFISSN